MINNFTFLIKTLYQAIIGPNDHLVQIDSLPDELIASILKDHLSLSEIVKCRRISKRFRFLVDNYVSVFINELSVSSELEFIKRCFDSSIPARNTAQSYYERHGRVLNENCHVKSLCESFWFLASPLCRTLFANLKCLVCNLKNHGDDLEILNEFVKLESLIIEPEITLRTCQTLSLPNLKYCSLPRIEYEPLNGYSNKNVYLTLESKVEILKVLGLESKSKLAFL